MAAFTRYMCLSRRINLCYPILTHHFTSESRLKCTIVRTLMSSNDLNTLCVRLENVKRLLSTEADTPERRNVRSKSTSDLGSLTSDILSSNIKAASVSSPSKDGGTEQSSSSSGSKKERSSRWTGKNAWKLGLLLLGGWATLTTGVLISIWGAPAVDPEGNEFKDEFSDLWFVQAYLKRALKEFRQYKQMLKDPSREKLLPDPLQYPYAQPPYTLVLEMTGVLVHPDWTYGTGWRFKKRPGIDYLLKQVGPPLFEIVIYTSEQGYNADPIVNNLDPNGFIMYRLYRDATRYMEGHHVKDLSCLNRDLSKVIIVDWNEEATKLQSQNRFLLKRWTGDDNDRTLIDLANFLRTLSMSGIEDVRSVLQHYNQFDDPIERFRENQRLLQSLDSSHAGAPPLLK
ncbi:mitochondrial import inner membrane translocase subunit TIM50 isoform X2 [Octopus sinensis]|uniref:Mitochondrial import inner membrane translocase subunit TIM50 n=1 Tax=Octopus sinensis TaxID=2607531 RepID=A0A6P7SHP1_9MOLL|nr:mitochondrial import inner membrane translocase subunit TIM50 isoform X2 [Octopus sinensis]